MAGSVAGQLVSGQGLNFGEIVKSGAVGALTAGAFSELGAGTQGLQQFGSKLANNIGSITLSDVGKVLGTIAERGLVTAGVDTVVEGGSFGNALENSVLSDVGAVGASAIGAASMNKDSLLAEGTPGYVLAHAGLGCALAAAEGDGCAGGAIGGATSALIAPFLVQQMGGLGSLTDGQRAGIAGISTLLGGITAGLAGQNAQAGANAAANEVLNNTLGDHPSPQSQDTARTTVSPMPQGTDGVHDDGSNAGSSTGVQTTTETVGAGALASGMAGANPGSAANASQLTLTPSQQATAWQGSGAYPGVDSYTDVVLQKGSFVVGAAPGQSAYYTSLAGFFGTDGTAQSYYQALQIQPNLTNPAYPMYRNGVTIYQVNGDIPAAFSAATTANPQYGVGGAPQLFVPGYQNSLTPVLSIPFKK